MSLIDPNTLPYRPCVGIVLLNAEGRIWIGRRFDDLVSQEYQLRWQMPQGGIDFTKKPASQARKSSPKRRAGSDMICLPRPWATP